MPLPEPPEPCEPPESSRDWEEDGEVFEVGAVVVAPAAGLVEAVLPPAGGEAVGADRLVLEPADGEIGVTLDGAVAGVVEEELAEAEDDRLGGAPRRRVAGSRITGPEAWAGRFAELGASPPATENGSEANAIR